MNRSFYLSLVAIVLAGTVRANWPMFTGDGNRVPPQQGLRFVDHLDDAPMLWELEHHMGVGKGLYPGHLNLSHKLSIVPFYGGASSPIVADGLVYVCYYRPDGKVPARVEPWRTVDENPPLNRGACNGTSCILPPDRCDALNVSDSGSCGSWSSGDVLG